MGMLVASIVSSSLDSLPGYSPVMCMSRSGAGFSALLILLDSETVYLLLDDWDDTPLPSD